MKKRVAGYTRFKLFWRIEKNKVLITRNIFSGKKVKVKDGGFAILFPWIEAKKVSLIEREIDYKPDTFEDKTGMDLSFDNQITYKIVDPEKYEYIHEDPIQKLKASLDAWLRVLIRKYPYEFLSEQDFSLRDNEGYSVFNDKLYTNVWLNQATGKYRGNPVIYGIDENLKEQTSEEKERKYRNSFELDLIKIKCNLDKFEETYGIRITNLKVAKILPSEEVRKHQEEVKAYEQKVKIAKFNKEIKKQEAAGDIELEKLRYQTEKKRISCVIDILLEKGVSMDKIMKYLLVSKEGAQTINLLSDNESSLNGVGATVAALSAMQNSTNDDSEKETSKGPKL